MAMNLCGYNGCRNVVKRGDSRCWRHKDAGAEGGSALTPEQRVQFEERAREYLEQLSRDPDLYRVMSRPTPSWTNGTSAHHDVLLAETPIAPDALHAVDAALARISVSEELNVPAVAAEAVNSRLSDFVSALTEKLGGDRVSRLRLVGFHRRTMTGREQHASEAYHEVIVLDRGTENEVVVDPFISLYAPVHDYQRPVDDQLPSGETPFGDLPWIGSVREYTGGSHMWWDHAEYVGSEVR